MLDTSPLSFLPWIVRLVYTISMVGDGPSGRTLWTVQTISPRLNSIWASLMNLAWWDQFSVLLCTSLVGLKTQEKEAPD